MTKEQSQYRKGVFQVVFCMVIWGVLPIYWKALIPISSSVIMLYRVLMSFLTALLLAHRNYTWQEIWAPLKEDRKTIRTLAVAGVIITINWSTYIWAVNAGFIIQTSLGYYIEPLVVCLLGIILFHERVTKYKVVAMIFALVAVLVLLFHFRQIPFIALGLALTFSVYAAIKRSVTVDPVLSMIYETMDSTHRSGNHPVSGNQRQRRRCGGCTVSGGFAAALRILHRGSPYALQRRRPENIHVHPGTGGVHQPHHADDSGHPAVP